MKTLIPILFFMLFNNKIFTQEFNYESEYYLLGTLSDNMGLPLIKEEMDNLPIDWVYENEYYQLYIIDSLLKISTFIQNDSLIKYQIVRKNRDLHYDHTSYHLMLSPKFNEYIRSFYRFKKAKMVTEEGYRIYLGRLKYLKIKRSTNNQILSFLAGAFFSFGTIKDNGYFSILIVNSKSKIIVIKRLLKNNGCKNIEYKEHKEGIPMTSELIFMPSEKIKSIFIHEKEVEKLLKQKIRN